MKITINRCARCGEDHKDVDAIPFKGRPVIADGKEYSYWLLCPRTGEPIFVGFGEGPVSKAKDTTPPQPPPQTTPITKGG